MGFNILAFLRFGSTRRRSLEKPEKNKISPPPVTVYKASNSDDLDTTTLGDTQVVENQSPSVQESEPVETRPVLASNASGPPPPYTTSQIQEEQEPQPEHVVPIPAPEEEQTTTDENRDRDDPYMPGPEHDNHYQSPTEIYQEPMSSFTEFTTYQVDGETNNNTRVHDANGVSTIYDSDAPKAFRTETSSDYAVTNNDADLIMDGGNPNVAASKRGSRRTVGHSYVTVNRANGTLTNNGSTLPAAYVEYTQNRMLRMREAQRRMEARYAAQTKPPEAAEETKQRELENLV